MKVTHVYGYFIVSYTRVAISSMAQIYGGLYLYVGPYHGIKGIKTSQVKAL